MEEKLRKFLAPYVGQGVLKKDKVLQEDVDMLVHSALYDHIEQEIIDYGTAHPEAPFWDFLKLIPPMAPEELEAILREINNEEYLREILQPYIGQGDPATGIVREEDVDMLIEKAIEDHIEQEILDYGTAHPEASFGDFLKLVKPGLKGITQEELLAEDDDDWPEYPC